MSELEKRIHTIIDKFEAKQRKIYRVKALLSFIDIVKVLEGK